MATIRAAGSKSVVDLFGAVSASATTLTDTTKSLGRVAQAGYAYTDAWATNVEANATAMKQAAGKAAEDRAAFWLQNQRQEIRENLDSKSKIEEFNAIKKELFG